MSYLCKLAAHVRDVRDTYEGSYSRLMATMFQTWSIFTIVTVLVVQLCTGEKPCVIWSSAGHVVQRYSSFEVFCTFKCNCKRSMYSGHQPTQQRHKEFNSTTIHFKVVNITESQTYSCKCACPPARDSCGLDIRAGYPPDHAKNISCNYTVENNKGGNVFCTWNRGRDTYLRYTTFMWVSAVSGNNTDKPETFSVPSEGTVFPKASFSMASSVQLITVWVQTKNQLGSAVSDSINYTLSDIVMPSTPNLSQPRCSSRECIMHVNQSVRTQHLQIQYRTGDQAWTSYPELGVQMSSAEVLSISSLEPYRLYHFRTRSKFSTGLWSQWSTSVSSQTQEEAPAKEMDVWYAEPNTDFKTLQVYWKQETNISITRGKITEYKVRVHSPNSNWNFSTNTSADARNYLVPFCADCEVTLWACNSIGLSPPATITTRYRKDKPLEDLQITTNNHSVTISWRKPETALRHVAFVVEWYPEGHKLEELKWVRLGRDDSRAVITNLRQDECYEGAVCVVYDENSVSRTGFTGVTTGGSVPTAGPSVLEKVEGNEVKVTWKEIPWIHRHGCITSYMIYLQNSSGELKSSPIPASQREHIIKDLPPGVYSLWMTASTAKGEGPNGGKLKFFIQQETQLSLLLVCVFLSVILSLLMCLYQISAVKRRLWVFLQCLMLNDVPDPANSKWAKECTQEKGKMNLQLEPSLTGEEEEPILVDVEELPQLSSDIHTPTDISTKLQLQTNLSPLTEPVLYPPTTYIKSFSHDSDSSKQTESSMDTNKTVDYISSHELGNMDEEDQEEDDEGEFAEMLDFFPSHNIIPDPLEFGGKLTLDAVKIDCNNLFHNF